MQVAPSQISPGEAFNIFYFLRNHTDATTYYVRAKVYDVRTGELLDTLNLEQASTNSRLFIKTATAPGDSAGYGRNIVAIATVYTDSGYTTKSENYEEQEQYFLVKAASFGGGGGGSLIDLSSILSRLDTIDNTIAAIPKPEVLPAMPFEQLFGTIGVLHREIGRIPKEAFDAQPVLDAIGSVKTALDALPKFEKTDLSQVSTGLTSALHAIEQTRKELSKTAATLLSEQERAGAELGDKVLARVEAGLKDLMSRQELTIPLSSLIKEKAPGEPVPMDLSHLM